MDTYKRPVGLTVMAVINFVMGGLAIFGALAMAALFPLLRYVGENYGSNFGEEEIATLKTFEGLGWPILIPLFAWGPIMAALLIVSGIGYLKCKRFMGRSLGNASAITSILFSIFFIFLPPTIGGGVNLSAFVGFIYPIVTLILINTTFRNNLVK